MSQISRQDLSKRQLPTRRLHTALRFLFNAMVPKKIDGFAFQGIPDLSLTDSGPKVGLTAVSGRYDCGLLRLLTQRNVFLIKEGLGYDNSPVSHMWRSLIYPDHPL